MEPQEYSHVFYEKRWDGYLYILFGLFLILISSYGAVLNPGSSGITVAAWVLGGIVVWQGRKISTNRIPLFQLGPMGLWTPKVGFLPWKQIHTQIESVSGFRVGTIHYLSIKRQKTREHLDAVALVSLGISNDELKALLGKYNRK